VGRTLAVPGEGNPDTEVVFVGEGPGYNEDQQGRPFVGAAGTLLNELMKQIGWKRADVYITNVVKCRPPGNRDPEAFEIEACAPFLTRQLEVLDPAVVVTLGRHSLQTFNPGARIGQTHGTVLPVDPATGAENALTYAMYHPAAALRAGALKRTMIEDMCGLPDALIDSRKRRQPAEDEHEAADEPVAIDIEPELIAVAIAQDTYADQQAVDENQISLF
jgi:DNA polymerase